MHSYSSSFFTSKLNIFAGLFALSGLLVACEEADQGNEVKGPILRPVKVYEVSEQDAELRRNYPATVLPVQQVDLSFRVSGQIVELPIRAAQRVAKGDVIAKLDMRDLENKAAQLQSQLDQAKANLAAMTQGARAEDVAALKASVAASQAQQDAARQQLERSETLFKKGVITKAQLDKDKTSLKVADADLESRKQELIKGQAGSRPEEVDAQKAAIKGLEAQVQAAQNDLTDATLRAPFSGVIAKRQVDNFVNIQAKELVAVLQKLDRLDLVIDIPATDVTRFSDEKKPQVKATLDALPDRRFDVELVDFSTQADAATQTFRARVSIVPPKDVTILPGMTGRIWVVEDLEGEKSLSIPLTALAAEPDGASFVWQVSSDNKVSKVPVTTGEVTGGQVAIKQGLKAGDVIASAGISSLQDGMQVKPTAVIGE
ncbi:MAG: efflux RND transporter periplasmic adaptor subunit [Cohaesibacter sp.]|jgi:RND family efflux transporter MFP subunit|nr:efflux RND transporter periplasmic adaptor subunit [Cohaesibacter sp.]